METDSKACMVDTKIRSPLAGDPNRMETSPCFAVLTATATLHPHSLGILIEWKPSLKPNPKFGAGLSPLAGDPNRMETVEPIKVLSHKLEESPLAGDPNRMETYYLTNRKARHVLSPLAGDPNRMETRCGWRSGRSRPHLIPTRWGS